MRLMRTHNFFENSILVSALFTASAATHFSALKETGTDDTKESCDARGSNCSRSSADLVIHVNLFIDRGNGDEVEKRHIFVAELCKQSHFQIALDILCSNLTTVVMGSHKSAEALYLY